MTWEETILSIRKDKDYRELIEKAYFEEDLELNINRFSKSEEFRETLKIIHKYAPMGSYILDIGCGNGISSINFALKGYYVTAVEPDSSKTVGAGAVRQLKESYKLDNLDVYEAYAEHIKFESNYFDIVYMRQAMHHANDLDKFINECVRVLKPNGLLLTIRDHVIYNEKDKQWFFESHPLHKFYEGENAFTSVEYRNAIKKAGARLIKELKYFDNIINYFPLSKEDLEEMKRNNTIQQKKKLATKVKFLGNSKLVWEIYRLLGSFKPLNEITIPGRMYSYIAIKK